MHNKDRRKPRTFDLKLFIQIFSIIAVGLSIWFGSQTTAAVMDKELQTHINSAVIHSDFERMTKQFVPREEMKVQLDNIDKSLYSMKQDIGKIETSVELIRRELQKKD